MNRRTFLGTIAATALFPRDFTFAAETHQIKAVGAQLYTVRSAMKEDFDGTLAKVAAIGYREVEFAGYFDRDPKSVKASLDRVGLAAPSGHFAYSLLSEKWPATLESAKIIGHEYVICPSIDEKLRQQATAWHRAAEVFNRAGEAARSAGLQFGYHNHWWEFQPVEGKLPYDILLNETDPNLVKMEMDLFWIIKGGADPLIYFQRYPGRFVLVHVKGRDKSGNMAAVSADNSIDWKSIFAHSEQAGIQHYFVEHDNPSSPFDSLRTSFHYLEGLRF
jgi:sugar phosphate isomerase/epimerase